MRNTDLNTAQKRASTRAAFFIAGFGMGSWAPLVPYAQHRLALDQQSLGSLLLCLGLGSLIAMLFSGKLTGRFGCRMLITLGTICIILSLPLLAYFSSFHLMLLSLFVFGAGVGVTDVTVNVQAALVEKASPKPLMSGFHGLFSVGGIVGAALGSILLTLGLTPVEMALTASGISLAVLLMFFKHLLPFAMDETTEKQPFKLNGLLLYMAAMCFVCFLAEGAMLDWSGIWLTAHQGLRLDDAGWGYAAFGCAMALMRLFGDKVLMIMGRKLLILISGLLAISGFLIAISSSSWEISILAFVLIGLGAANIVPIVTTLASRDTTMPANMSVAFVSTIGYLGILMGPAVIGFIAHKTSLSIAFFCVATSLLTVVFGAKIVVKNIR